jgi:hypothetical protein
VQGSAGLTFDQFFDAPTRSAPQLSEQEKIQNDLMSIFSAGGQTNQDSTNLDDIFGPTSSKPLAPAQTQP